ncbi:hypothetical protein [Mariniflexile fucanivorans]|uniref:hypothetical protein n=1 Tax=Mariniflexile fucanivorans TaxID=264023 RepID=UPI0010533BD6|nr:hypothetical protein [Mariniflexile fucanivorans]
MEGKIFGVILKKIASIGVWGNGRFPQLLTIVVRWQQRNKCIFFYLLTWIFVIGFKEKLMPYKMMAIGDLIPIYSSLENVLASAFTEINNLIRFWQIKNYTLVG